MTYTDEELLAALRAFADDHDGRPPTVIEANERDDLPSATAFVYRFETWNAAVEAAGLDARNRHRSDEELLADLREFAADLGRIPTYTETTAREGMASGRTYENHFGTWNRALRVAGLPAFDCE